MKTREEKFKQKLQHLFPEKICWYYFELTPECPKKSDLILKEKEFNQCKRKIREVGQLLWYLIALNWLIFIFKNTSIFDVFDGSLQAKEVIVEQVNPDVFLLEETSHHFRTTKICTSGESSQRVFPYSFGNDSAQAKVNKHQLFKRMT